MKQIPALLLIHIHNMHGVIEIFQYGFMIRAAIAGITIALIAPLIGSFLVVRRLSLIADSLSHVALTGVALGLLMGVNPLVTTILTTICIALLIEQLRRRSYVSAESILAMILPGGLAMALILISVGNGLNANIFTYLFGSITTVTENDILIILALGAVIGVLFMSNYRSFMYTSFDEESARTSGIPVQRVNMLFMILVALTISLSMKIVGALLIGALMVIPVVTAMTVVKGFKNSILLAIGFALISVLVGLITSYYANVPAGAAIVVISLLLYLAASLKATR